MTRNKPSFDLLDRLEQANVPKGVIAKRLTLAPSAVTDLYAGRRQLKYDEAIILEEMLPESARARELPLIGLVGAGQWLEAIEETRRQIPMPPQVSGKFAVEVVGRSMNLVLPEGSIAIVDPDEVSLHVGKIYLLRNADGEATIKRFRMDPARFEPVSDDPEFVPFEIGSTDFKVIGRVTGGLQIF